MKTQVNNNIRELKVGRTFQKRENSFSPAKFPSINLKGKWLQDAGFEHTDIIHVEVLRGRMVITKKEQRP